MAALHLSLFTSQRQRDPSTAAAHHTTSFVSQVQSQELITPNWLSKEVHGHLAHIIWTQVDETLDCGIDRQQHPTDDVFMDNIVALGMSMGIEEIIDEEIR